MLRTFSIQHRDTDILRVWFILSEATSRTSVDAYCFPWPLECASNLCRYIVTFLCRQGVSLNVSFTGVEITSQVRRILPALNASAWCFWSPSIIQTSGRHGGVKLSHVSSKTQSSSSWIKMMLLASSLLLNNNHQANDLLILFWHRIFDCHISRWWAMWFTWHSGCMSLGLLKGCTGRSLHSKDSARK